MTHLIKWYQRFSERLWGMLQSEKGQTLVEYALIMVLIAVVLILMIKGTGQEINNTWSKINSSINP